MYYRDRETGQYPLIRSELIARHPHTSFPIEWNEGVLDFLAVDQVFLAPAPQPQPGFIAREIEPEMTEAGTWEQRWEMVPAPPSPLTDADLSETDETWI